MASLIGFPVFDFISFKLAKLSFQVLRVPTVLPASGGTPSGWTGWYFRSEWIEKLRESTFPMQYAL
jgi:hypothetical protein